MSPDAPEYGLLPIAFGDGGVAGLRAEYTTVLWTLIGLKLSADVSARLWLDGADEVRGVFEGLLADFRVHAQRDMRKLPDGTPYLPMLKDGSGRHNRVPAFEGDPDPWELVNPGSATWALAHAIYPGEIVSPDDPLVRNFCHLLDTLADEQGIPANTGWLPFDAVWPYCASFYAHAWLYAGRHDKAVEYLYAFANHAAPTRVWREEQSLRRSPLGKHYGDMPHNWASAEFIRLVRNLLVFERGDALELLHGLPPEWIVPCRPVRVHRTPTRYGAVSVDFEDAPDGSWRAEVQCDLAWRLQPSTVTLRVPAGAGARLLAGDTEVVVGADGLVALPVTDRVMVTGGA